MLTVLLFCQMGVSPVWAVVEGSAQSQVPPSTTSSADTAAISSWKTYLDQKLKFEVKYPVSWKVEPSEKPVGSSNPIVVSFSKPDQSALVSILEAQNVKVTSPIDFLKQMDLSRKMKNLVPPGQQKLSTELIKKSGADDGSIGSYELPGKKPVLQRVLVLKRKDEIFVITGSFQKKKQADEDPLSETILGSFALKP